MAAYEVSLSCLTAVDDNEEEMRWDGLGFKSGISISPHLLVYGGERVEGGVDGLEREVDVWRVVEPLHPEGPPHHRLRHHAVHLHPPPSPAVPGAAPPPPPS